MEVFVSKATTCRDIYASVPMGSQALSAKFLVRNSIPSPCHTCDHRHKQPVKLTLIS